MRKILALVSSLLLVATFATPAQSAGAKYSAYQKTLATFSSSATTLTTQQKDQVRASVEANPTAEKFICTGIRYYDQPMSVNITVRKRAKAACEYARQLNPALSTWFQNKQTRAKSYAGKVLLTVKTLESRAGLRSHSYITCDTPAVDTLVPRVSQDLVTNVTCSEDAQTPPEALPYAAIPSDPKLCELKDMSSGRAKYGHLIVGFPRTSNNLDPLERHKVTVIPLDWEDFSGKGLPSTVHRPAVEKFINYYNDVSYGSMKLELDFADQWFRLPGQMLDYKVTENDYQNTYSERTKLQKTRLLHNGVQTADPSVDFSDTAIVIFVLPEGQTALDLTLQGFWNADLPSPAQSNEGLIKNFFTAGNAFPLKEVWSYYAHEFGHTIMLPDYYLQVGNFGNDAQIQIPVGPFSGFDMMSTQGGPSRTMSLWSRFLMGWTQDSHFYCADYSQFKDTSLSLSPIDQVDNEMKGAIFPVSDSRAVVVESRRETIYDEKTTRSRNGVIVYTVDTTINHGEGTLSLVPPHGRGLYYPYPGSAGQPQLDAMLYVGNSVTVEGLTITLNASGDTDLVSVKKN
jgi:M6 family metalloprotease-like protein